MSVMSPSILPSRSRRITAAGFDPLTQPIVQSTALQALAPSSLEPDFIRSAFSCQVKWQVEPVFTKSFKVDSMQPDNVVQAAVLFPLVPRTDRKSVGWGKSVAVRVDSCGARFS